VQSDPFRVDRKLAEAAGAWLAWRRALRRGAGADHRFERLGAFASHELVLELRAASAGDPLAPSLAAWAHRLHLEHGTLELVAQRERAFRVERHALSTPEAGKFTLRELVDAALADTKGARHSVLDALSASSGAVADFELQRWERRIQLSTALGDTGAKGASLAATGAETRAKTFLEATDELMPELGAKDLSTLIELALGRGSVASWPARLTGRSLAALFDEAKWLEHVAFELDEFPRPLGASSHLRGLVAFGSAFASALAPAKLPFVVAHEPFDLRGATFGALFALVPFGESFARRKLDVPRARLPEHRRVLARAVLVGARALALRVLLRAPTLAGRRALTEAYPELVFRVLGVELPARAASVLFRSRISDPERFLGLLAAAERAERLQRAHDEDWYRNPRAVDELREITRQTAPSAPSDEAFERGSLELAGLLRSAP
jgi:hypothetical protein